MNELLVENGLARIYGTRTALFDGRTRGRISRGSRRSRRRRSAGAKERGGSRSEWENLRGHFAEELSSAGWSIGFVSYFTRDGRKMHTADAHKGGVRYVVHAETLAVAMLELKCQALAVERVN